MSGVVFTLSEEAGLVCRMEMNKRKAKITGEYEGEMLVSSSFSSMRELNGNTARYINSYGLGRRNS